jgi:hypothetical protein
MPAPDRWHADFFVLRAPLLPASVFDALAAEAPGASPEAVVADETRILEALRAVAARPDVAEALRVASPSLFDALGKGAPGAAQSLYAYVARASTRATPFGLFAGCAVGRIGTETALALSSDLRRHTRLDAGWLEQLVRRAESSLRARLVWSPNTTLTRIGATYRYAESRVERDTGARTNAQVALDHTPAIEAALAAAPATPDGLAQAVRAAIPGVTVAEAADFIRGLLDAGLFASELTVATTADDQLGELVDRLRPHHRALAMALGGLGAGLARLDAGGVGQDARIYASIEAALARFPVPADTRRLLHVDLYRGGALSLGPSVLGAIEEARRLLARITPGDGQVFPGFAERFLERYGGGEWPLAEVLDPDAGIGLDERDGAAPSPLLAGIASAPRPDAAAPFGPRERWMLGRVLEAGPGGEWRLDEDDLAALTVAGGAPLPDAHAFLGSLDAASAEDVDRGRFTLDVAALSGPSGVRLFGRFCLGDPELRAQVEAHLRAEEALAPDVVFAEIVHQPEGRAGNVIARPRLRTWEIPYGGVGAAVDHALPIDDLLVSVVPDPLRPIRLRSRRLGRTCGTR